MKRCLFALLSLWLALCLAACGSTGGAVAEPQNTLSPQTITADTAPTPTKTPPPTPTVAPSALDAADVDLTLLSSTMVYAEVYNMMVAPEEYIGKRVRMTGAFSVFTDEATGKLYFSCIIADATACCSQGLEFVLLDVRVYPDEYPAVGESITVTGIFDVYDEDGYAYIQLKNATLEGYA